MRVVVVTVQRGRWPHLQRQQRAIRALADAIDGYVVVSMDPTPPPHDGEVDLLRLPVPPGERLPVARARNAGIRRAALQHRADLVICLDVDVIPLPGFVDGYVAAARAAPDSLLAGPVTYLPPGIPAGVLPTDAELADLAPHAARPAPTPGALVDEPRMELFWSLFFAVRPQVHERLGGFDPSYEGYGAEDTDYAMRARAAGIGLTWVGSARAVHQHHPVSSPPIEHLDDIVLNARRFHAIWRQWPMAGWLTAFARAGLIRWHPEGTVIERIGPTPAAGASSGGRPSDDSTFGRST